MGENGSGKTTVIRLITGLIHATEGNIELFGAMDGTPDIYAARKKIGAVVETPSIYLNMSARDNLEMQCDILGIKDKAKAAEVLKEVGLSDLYTNKKHASNFSLGMRQRLGIAMALIGDPEFLILDEPMNGLDPAGIVEIRELIIRLNRERGITFLISSHILTELALVATTYGIISKGKIIKEISAEELNDECRRSITVEAADRDALTSALSGIVAEGDLRPTSLGVKIYGTYSLNELLSAILSAGVEIGKINCNDAAIEDYYLSLIGGAAHD